MSLEASRKSRSYHIGVVTREHNKCQILVQEDPATYDLDRLESRLERFTLKADEFSAIHQAVCDHEEQINQHEEQEVADRYDENLEATLSLLRRLIAMQKVHQQISELSPYMRELEATMGSNPTQDHSASVSHLTQSVRDLTDPQEIYHPIRASNAT